VSQLTFALKREWLKLSVLGALFDHEEALQAVCGPRLALGLSVLAVAALQAPQWRALARGEVTRPSRGRAGSGALPAA